MDFILI